MNSNSLQPLDIKSIIRSKNKTLARLLPGFIIRYIHNILHIDGLNYIITNYGHQEPKEFLNSCIKYFNVTVEVEGKENISNEPCIFVSNHPLGGLDGIILIYILSEYYGENVKPPVNDILMNLKPITPFFIPVNKHGKQSSQAVRDIYNTLSGTTQLITFPAGLVSRKIKGKIQDPAWTRSFIQWAEKYKRHIIPVHFSGRNTNFFYNLARFRKKLGIKANIEMFFLVDELFKHRNKTFTVSFGTKIDYGTFDKSKKRDEWAFEVKQKAYALGNQTIDL